MKGRLMTVDLTAVYEALYALMKPLEKNLVVVHDDPGNYYVNTRIPWRGKDLYFGGIVIRKNYVSYYLMGVYMYPDLLDGMSDALRKRMQGKSCFNFKSDDSAQLKELGVLTKKCLQRMKKEGNA
ncbi:MAG: hypothetical protein RRA94_02865 [Bacteroidota bacterium]|nr:hypothetical protein [Bacteroidota bacterium]